MCLPYAICTCSVTFSHHVSLGKLAQEKHVIIFCCRSLFIDRMAAALFLSLWISVGCFDGCGLLPSVWFWLQWQSVPIASHQKLPDRGNRLHLSLTEVLQCFPGQNIRSPSAVCALSLCQSTYVVSCICHIAWVSWICQALFLRRVFLLAHAGGLQMNFKATGWVPIPELIRSHTFVSCMSSCAPVVFWYWLIHYHLNVFEFAAHSWSPTSSMK